ncbi:MAG: hypothetical protein HZB26_20795, partial [Candidatus Hydrogenedentes bacterium]|nr:hypothetical protein [Candidatus Hydrogenedentota bacterium]
MVAMFAAIGAESYGAKLTVDAVGHTERVIYHSPETPGYTSWVGLWQLPDGRLRCDFRQITGPKEKPVSQAPVLESRDGGATWTRVNSDSPSEGAVGTGGGIFQLSKECCRGMAVLRDGTLV